MNFVFELCFQTMFTVRNYSANFARSPGKVSKARMALNEKTERILSVSLISFS